MSQQIFVGRLGIDSHGDSWLLQTAREALLRDVPDFELLNHEELNEGTAVSVNGWFGVPSSSTTTQLLAQQLVSHPRVRTRAFDISRRNGWLVDHWLPAERVLLGLGALPEYEESLMPRMFAVTMITQGEFVEGDSSNFDRNYLQHFTEEPEKAANRLWLRTIKNLLLALCCVLLASARPVRQTEWKRITPVARGHQMPINKETGHSTPVHATRLIFEYDGDRVRLLEQMPVEVAGANLPMASEGELGTFVDVRDATNRTLARVPAGNALSTSLEVFPERHGQPITRTEVPRSKGAFTVVVPTPKETTHATLVNVAASNALAGVAGAPAAAPEVVDLVSFPLRASR